MRRNKRLLFHLKYYNNNNNMTQDFPESETVRDLRDKSEGEKKKHHCNRRGE